MMKQSKRLKPILLIACSIIGLLLCADAAFLITISANIGNFLVFALGLLLIAVSLLYNKLGSKLQLFIKYTSAIATIVVAAMLALIITKGANDSATFTEDYVVVLGASVKGKNPMLPLQLRLDKCVEYATRNPNATIIVSGGKGLGEDIAEAEAMKHYLTTKGVNPRRIVKEDRSTDTYENFAYSKQIIDSLSNNQSYNVACITNDFHSYRAQQIGKRMGVNVSTYTSSLPLYLRPPTYLREILSIWKFWIYR